MSLLYGTGLRLEEALSLRLQHIDGERQQVRVVKGKGAKDRYVELPECLLHLLRQYYRAYRPQVYLFQQRERPALGEALGAVEHPACPGGGRY